MNTLDVKFVHILFIIPANEKQLTPLVIIIRYSKYLAGWDVVDVADVQRKICNED